MHFLIIFVLTAVVTLPARGEQEKFFLRFLFLERPTQPKPWPVRMICYFHKKNYSMFWLEKLSLCPTHRQIWMWLPMTAQLRWSSSHSFPRTNNSSSFILIHVQACDILQRKKDDAEQKSFTGNYVFRLGRSEKFYTVRWFSILGFGSAAWSKTTNQNSSFFFVEVCDCLLYRELADSWVDWPAVNLGSHEKYQKSTITAGQWHVTPKIAQRGFAANSDVQLLIILIFSRG